MNDWNCNEEQEHYAVLSDCCGVDPHPDADGFCGGCNEFASWSCPVCEDECEWQNVQPTPTGADIDLHSALGAVWGTPVYDDGDITVYQGGSK